MQTRASSAFGAALLALAAVAQPSGTRPPFEMLRGAICDPQRGVVYVAGAQGDVEAIDVTDGRSLWTSSAAALPLALHRDLLATQGEEPPSSPRLRIVVLHANDGRTVAESVTELPARVRATIVDTPMNTLRAAVKYDACAFVVSWTDRQTLAGGAAPPPGQAPPVREFDGTARVPLPVAGAEEIASSETACVRATVAGARGEAVTLKRTNTCTGAGLPDLVLAKSAIVALLSADGAHVLASDREGAGYRWLIFATATGERIGELRRDVSAAPFFVAKGLIVFTSQPHGFRRGDQWIEVPLELVAVKLSSGDEVWHRAIRDLHWRGPVPPLEKSK